MERTRDLQAVMDTLSYDELDALLTELTGLRACAKAAGDHVGVADLRARQLEVNEWITIRSRERTLPRAPSGLVVRVRRIP